MLDASPARDCGLAITFAVPCSGKSQIDAGTLALTRARAPAPKQDFQRHAENREHRDTQQRLSVQRPGPRRPLSMNAQLVNSVAAATNHQRRLRGRLLSPQQRPLLNPATRHAHRLAIATVIPLRPARAPAGSLSSRAPHAPFSKPVTHELPFCADQLAG